MRDYDSAAVRIDWPRPDPLPDATMPVPAFADALLPAVLRPWIMDIAERMQCPADFPAVACLVGLASVSGRQVGVRPKQHDDWTVIPNLWGAVIGRPGVLKTPAIQEPMRPLHRLELAARDKYTAAQREHEAAEVVAKATAKQRDREVAAAVKAGNLVRANELAAEEATAAPMPMRARYVTSDCTVEALGEVLAHNPRGVLLFRDELVGWLSSMDREGREGTRQFFLEAWNGDGRYTYDRIGRGTVDIEACCVSVLGAIQPGPLGEYLRRMMRGGAGDDGLIQRLQVAVWPDIADTWRDIDRWPDTPSRQRAWSVYQRLDSLDPVQVGAQREGDGVPYLRLDPDAQVEFSAWRAKLEARLRSGELSPPMEAHLSKFRSLVPSIALVSHLADAGEGPVSIAAMMRALAWADYLEGHAARIYGQMIAPELAAAAVLGDHIQRGDLASPFGARDVYRRGWRGLDVETTPKVLAVLVDHGWLRAARVDTGVGRPTVAYTIHPGLRS